MSLSQLKHGESRGSQPGEEFGWLWGESEAQVTPPRCQAKMPAPFPGAEAPSCSRAVFAVAGSSLWSRLEGSAAGQGRIHPGVSPGRGPRAGSCWVGDPRGSPR